MSETPPSAERIAGLLIQLDAPTTWLCCPGTDMTVGELRAALRSHARLVEAERLVTASCRDASDEMRKRATDMREWRHDLMTYGWHKPGCVVAGAVAPNHPSCDCGLRRQIETIDQALASVPPTAFLSPATATEEPQR